MSQACCAVIGLPSITATTFVGSCWAVVSIPRGFSWPGAARPGGETLGEPEPVPTDGELVEDGVVEGVVDGGVLCDQAEDAQSSADVIKMLLFIQDGRIFTLNVARRPCLKPWSKATRAVRERSDFGALGHCFTDACLI